MFSNIPKEFKRYSKQCKNLNRILNDTYCTLDEISTNLQLGREIKEELLNNEIINNIKNKLESIPTLLIFGQDCHTKALLINNLLNQIILPLFSTKWRYITFMYGNTKKIRLTVDNDFEIVEKLKADEKPWITIPEQDLQRTDYEESLIDHCPSLEVELCNLLLKENVRIIIPPDLENLDQLIEILKKNLNNVLPVIIYAISDHQLSDNNIQEIRRLKDIYDLPFLFVSVVNNDPTESLTESEQHSIECDSDCKIVSKLQNLYDQLIRLGFLNDAEINVKNNKENNEKEEIENRTGFCLNYSLYNILICDTKMDENIILFIKNILKANFLKMATFLSEIHNKCLKKFIFSAFDMAREIQITPKRILYAQEIELKLYKKLMNLAGEQQEEITKIIQNTLHNMRLNVKQILEEYNENENNHQKTTKIITLEIQHLVLKHLRNSVATQIVQSVSYLHESFIGTLQRCLESLEKNCHDFDGNLSASNAVKQILTAAYNIDLKSSTSFSIIHSFVSRLRTLLTNFITPTLWSTNTTNNTSLQYNLQWQIQIVTNLIDSLNAFKLAKTISIQFQEIIKLSHESFQSAIRSLENQLSGQLEQTEEQRVMIRKVHAPKFARLSLESTSLCDYVIWGMPIQIREIGRGQYGVVSSCKPWANINPCAYKSIVPLDDRHWNDLAMEFYYTRTIPEHPRIVKLRGSVIDYSYGGGCTPAVLLIMERMTRDLHTGLRNGLSWSARLRISIDVVEGIRYLHSQGLVHRDIKLKNVLLDCDNRAKLTDFGFCIPEAMMSGSIVGTPIHMAPELLSGRYDSSVDVYAFGILLWYICSGQVKLPDHFFQFQNKEQLWSSVRKGIRPECLPTFNRACWNLMEQCWAAEPSERPLLGYVQPQLEIIYKNTLMESTDCQT